MQLEQLKNSYKFLYHASIYIDKGIYIDPYKIENNSHDAKYIFITHSHFDHLSLEDIAKIVNDKTIFIATFDSIDILKKYGYKNEMICVETDKDYNLSDLEFTPIKAYNKTKQFHPILNNWVGYKIKTNNVVYYIVGDSDYNDYMNDIKCDVLFVPIGGTYTMDYIEASKLTNSIKPKIVVPIHFNTLSDLKVDINKFIELINKNIIID